MSAKILLPPIGVAVALALLWGPALPGVSTLWGAEPGDDPFAVGPGDQPFAAEPGDDPFAVGPGDDPFAAPPPARAEQGKPPGTLKPNAPFGLVPRVRAEHGKPLVRPKLKEEQRPALKLRFGTEAILKALEEPVSWTYCETPLQDVIDDLKDKHKIQTVLDHRALDDVGVPSDCPITFSISGIPLRSALELMLGQLDLTWTVASDVLLITTPEEAENLLVTKTYDVSDLLVTPSDREYRGDGLPTTPPGRQWPFEYAPSDLYDMPMPGGGYHDDGMGVMDGAAWGWTSPQAQNPSMDDLIDLIQTTIAPDSWDQVGGAGSCSPYGRVLAISQTIAIQLQIEELLAAVRAVRQSVPAVVVDARWLLLDSDLLDQLLDNSRRGDAGRITLDPRVLDLITRDVPSFRAAITCMSGRKVYLAAGDRRSVVYGAIPVVGSGVGYQPVVRIPNVGLLLEIRPTITPGTQSAMLDVKSTVTGWGEPDRALRVGTHFPPGEVEDPYTHEKTDVPGGEASVDVDRVTMPTHEFAATTRVPLGKPVLLGGLTLSPTTEADQPDQERKQLYLIIQTSRIADNP